MKTVLLTDSVVKGI